MPQRRAAPASSTAARRAAWRDDSFGAVRHGDPFGARVVAWQRVHGRHDLPWQNTHDAYRIWLSEIMLQQTQVSTVLPYYARFVAAFPDVRSLAAAPLE